MPGEVVPRGDQPLRWASCRAEACRARAGGACWEEAAAEEEEGALHPRMVALAASARAGSARKPTGAVDWAQAEAAAAVGTSRAPAWILASVDGAVSSPDRPNNAVRWNPAGRRTSRAGWVSSWADPPA
jgi:hypothetical protein